MARFGFHRNPNAWDRRRWQRAMGRLRSRVAGRVGRRRAEISSALGDWYGHQSYMWGRAHAYRMRAKFGKHAAHTRFLRARARLTAFARMWKRKRRRRMTVTPAMAFGRIRGRRPSWAFKHLPKRSTWKRTRARISRVRRRVRGLARRTSRRFRGMSRRFSRRLRNIGRQTLHPRLRYSQSSVQSFGNWFGGRSGSNAAGEDWAWNSESDTLPVIVSPDGGWTGGLNGATLDQLNTGVWHNWGIGTITLCDALAECALNAYGICPGYVFQFPTRPSPGTTSGTRWISNRDDLYLDCKLNFSQWQNPPLQIGMDPGNQYWAKLAAFGRVKVQVVVLRARRVLCDDIRGNLGYWNYCHWRFGPVCARVGTGRKYFRLLRKFSFDLACGTTGGDGQTQFTVQPITKRLKISMKHLRGKHLLQPMGGFAQFVPVQDEDADYSTSYQRPFGSVRQTGAPAIPGTGQRAWDLGYKHNHVIHHLTNSQATRQALGGSAASGGPLLHNVWNSVGPLRAPGGPDLAVRTPAHPVDITDPYFEVNANRRNNAPYVAWNFNADQGSYIPMIIPIPGNAPGDQYVAGVDGAHDRLANNNWAAGSLQWFRHPWGLPSWSTGDGSGGIDTANVTAFQSFALGMTMAQRGGASMTGHAGFSARDGDRLCGNTNYRNSINIDDQGDGGPKQQRLSEALVRRRPTVSLAGYNCVSRSSSVNSITGGAGADVTAVGWTQLAQPTDLLVDAIPVGTCQPTGGDDDLSRYTGAISYKPAVEHRTGRCMETFVIVRAFLPDGTPVTVDVSGSYTKTSYSDASAFMLEPRVAGEDGKYNAANVLRKFGSWV